MIERIDHAVRLIALWAGGIFLVALTLITVTDVVMRGFNSPILGARDIAQLCLIIVVSSSIAYSGRSGGQVAVELFGSFASETVTRWTDIVMRFIGFLMLMVLSWHLMVAGSEVAEFGEATGTLQISYEPFFYVSAVGIFLYGIVLLAEVCLLARRRSIDYDGD
jgi:TRAP-type C4-dicarboxylate transport system permease small subunit